MLQLIRKLAGTATQFAIFWAYLWMPSSCNRLIIYVNATSYYPVSFRVADAVYDADSDSSPIYWFTGTVEGHEEDLVPPLSGTEVNSSEELPKLFPKGTVLPAMYDHLMPGAFFQGESLRLR